jgi:hypothetical protein
MNLCAHPLWTDMLIIVNRNAWPYLLFVTDMYQVERLKLHCVSNMWDMAREEIVTSFLWWAIQANCTQLQDRCMSLLERIFPHGILTYDSAVVCTDHPEFMHNLCRRSKLIRFEHTHTTRNLPLEHQLFLQHHIFGCNIWFYNNEHFNGLQYLDVMATKNVGCVCWNIHCNKLVLMPRWKRWLLLWVSIDTTVDGENPST